MAVASPSEWDDFRLTTFGDPYVVHHDGPQFDALLAAWIEQRDYVRAMLCLGIDRQDPIAPQSIAFLLSQPDGPRDLGPALERSLSGARGTFRVRVAEVLFTLTKDQSYAEPICKVLANGTRFDRVDAAIALNAFAPSAIVVRALARGVEDEEYLVRRHSAQSLLTLAGSATTIEDDVATWALIRPDHKRSLWRKAAAVLTAPWDS